MAGHSKWANAIAAVNKLTDALEEHDDVKEFFSNAEFFEGAAKA